MDTFSYSHVYSHFTAITFIAETLQECIRNGYGVQHEAYPLRHLLSWQVRKVTAGVQLCGIVHVNRIARGARNGLAERVAQHAADPSNLTWTMPA